MASHNYAPIRALDRELVVLAVKATGGGAAADLTALSARAGVTSINYNAATGKYTVTLDAKYQELRHLSGTVLDPTAVDDWEVVLETDLTANTATFNICVFKGGVLTDLTSDEKLMLLIVLKNSSR